MKKKTLICYCLKKPLILLFLIGLLFGGDNLLASTKNIYRVIAIKVDSNIKTTFNVYAENKDEAAEEVALNGWDIVEVKFIKKDSMPNDSILPDKLKKNSYIIKNNKNDLLPIRKKNLQNFNSKYILVTYFDFAKDTLTLTEKEKNTIKKLKPDFTYYIYGHTDSVPVKDNSKFKNNYDLSLKRANYIKRKIVELAHIPPENIKVVGLGEFYPAVSNKLDGAAKNRRVEIYEKIQ